MSRRSRGDGCKLLPPWNKGPGDCLLLHAGGYHHARHHSGVRAGCKCDTQLAQRPQRHFWIIPGHWSLQKLNKKKHFSKTKHSKFNESGQLSAFYLFSFAWGASILLSVCIVKNLGCLLCLLVLRTNLKEFFWCFFVVFCFLTPPGKLPLQSSQLMGRLSPYADAVSCAAESDSCASARLCMFQTNLNRDNVYSLSFLPFLKIPDEILLHLSAGLLVARTPRTLFPKDKEGECVFWLAFRPRVCILFDFPWFFCIVLKNCILYY